MPVPSYAWVTNVVGEETCLQALVLAKSLRRVITIGNIVVVVSKNLNPALCTTLSEVFDVLVPFGDVSEENCDGKEWILNLKEEGKITSWNQTAYDKCIVLAPFMLVMRNCDELFELPNEITLLGNKTRPKCIDDGLMIIKPSYVLYAELMLKLKTNTVAGALPLNQFLEESFLAGHVNILEPGQIGIIDAANDVDTLATSVVKMLDFSNITPTQLFNKSMESSGGKISLIWMEILMTEVVPHISNKTMKHLGLDKLQSSFNNERTEELTKTSHNEWKNSIAIVGQSCRLPGANSVEEFWKLLESGREGISRIPLDRLPEHLMDDPRYNSILAGFLKCPIDEFDAKFFGISPRELAFMDPQQRLLVEVAWEALENAAINPLKLKGSNTAVFSGVWTHEYEFLLTQNTTGKDFHHVVLGNAFSAASARVSYFLGLNGPNVAAESGCCSSMVALHLACDSLRKRETDLALATGVNLLVNHFPHNEVAILAKDGHCKTFDESADGFARAEGVVVVVLKRFCDAVRDGDRILSIVRGSAISSEGLTSSFGTPSKYCQEIAIRDALRVAGVKPEDVDYVEAHGTGTPIGDPIEFAAISAGYSSPRNKPLIIGSVKTNTGHTESASGLAGLLKVNLALENEMIPSHLNFKNLNPNIKLDVLPAVIPLENTPWVKNPKRKRLAGVSSFGISGTNVHVILEETPKLANFQLKSIENDRTHHLLTLSAKTENALKDTVDQYIGFLRKNPEMKLKDICYTANVGRQHLKHRLAVVAKETTEMKHKLEKITNYSETKVNDKSKTVFLFTGQGSQYPSMGMTLYETSPVFRNAINACEKILTNNFNISIISVLLQENNSINETMFSQTSIFCVEYALLKLWESFGLKPDYVLGHSVGEFAACVSAEILSLEDALTLVAHRSRLIHSLPKGGMLAVRTNKENVQNLIESFSAGKTDDWLDIAVVNSPDEVVVSGKESTLKSFLNFCSQRKFKCQLLAASHAFHSRDMIPILQEFGNIASQIKYKSPTCNYVSGSTGKLITGAEMNTEYWQNHARYTVDFTMGINFVHQQGCNTFIEIGAHPVLLSFGMTNLPPFEIQDNLWLPSIRKNEDNWITLLESVSKLYINGTDINWEGLDFCYLREKVVLPHYPFQRQKYWIESKSDGPTKSLHPLLGSKIPLANIKEHVFQNTLSLDDLSYLADHQVANVIIMPGAGFLEILLAAGREIFNYKSNQGKNLLVQDFVVEAPMELVEGKHHKIQVVASNMENFDGFLIQVFVYKNIDGCSDEKGWRAFAGAKVSLCEVSNVESNFEDAKARCLETRDPSDYYKIASDAGIQFGETFLSISNIWKGENETIVKIPNPKAVGNISEYVFHPIVLDAMIQAAGMHLEKSELSLPVGINYFSVISKQESPFYFAHVYESLSKVLVDLYDEKNNLICQMGDVRLVKTTISPFLNVINALKNTLPGLYEVAWRPKHPHLHACVNFSSLPKMEPLIKEIDILMTESIKSMHQIETLIGMYDKVVKLGILSNLQNTGWTPKLGDVINVDSFVTDHSIVVEHIAFLERLFYILGEDMILKRTENSEWIVNKHILPISDLDILIKNTAQEIRNLGTPCAELPMILHCINTMCDMLQGKRPAVEVLFGNDDPNISPLEIFANNGMGLANERAMYFMQCKFNSAKDGSIVRIIEIGAGSAATSSHILKGLQQQGIPYRYTFTDISPFFFEKARLKFKDYSGVEYKVLNIEKDPKYQGFVPHTYDVVVAGNVIHATEYLSISLQNVRQLLRPSGIFLLQEMLTPVIFIDYIYGVMEGYWRFKDYDIRANHPCVNETMWNKLLQQNGFKFSQSISDERERSSIVIAEASDIDPNYSIDLQISKAKSSAWILFTGANTSTSFILKQKMENCGELVILVTSNSIVENKNIKFDFCIDFSNEAAVSNFLTSMDDTFDVKGLFILMCLDNSDIQEDISKPMLYIMKHLVNSSFNPKVIVATRGVHYFVEQTNVFPSQATVVGIAKSCMLERPDARIVVVDLDPDNSDPSVGSEQLFCETWLNDEHLFAYRKQKRYVARCIKMQSNNSSLVLPERLYKIVIPESKKINDISFKTPNYCSVDLNEVEILIQAASLNFRDIMVIIKPDNFHTEKEAVGTDFSGIITNIGDHVSKFKIGDEVYGVATNGCIATHVIENEGCLLKKPKEFTFEEASTLPSVLLTAQYCLINIANLKKGETILIHVAAGGVGLVAIQIANIIGANIIATAGKKRKRNYLRSIGVKNVFHSRDLSFGENIDVATNGRGVDMVLNSLTGHGFKETSLKACARNARFVEMGKVNIWQPDDVKKLRPDVVYTIVNLEILAREEMASLMKAMDELVQNRHIKPIPYTRFFASQIKDALNYFSKANHIGKIVVAMPKIVQSMDQKITKELLFNNKGTYLITGGLGGIGLEVAKWMGKYGAKYILLVGRTAPSETTLQVIKAMAALNIEVVSLQVDVGDMKQCETMFEQIRTSMPPLRGVIHSAGALSDGMIRSQTWNKYEEVFNAKVKGG